MTVNLAYRTHGPIGGRTVALLGPLGAPLTLWDPLIGHLPDDYRVLAVDLRGHGQSPTPSGPYTIAGLADDVVELFRRLALSEVAIVGASLGGTVAQWIAGTHPKSVTALVLLGTNARTVDPAPWLDRARLVRQQGTKAIANQVSNRWLTAPFATAHPDITNTIRAVIADADDEGYAASCEAIADWDGTTVAPQITAPTRILVGDQDLSTPVKAAHTASQLIPHTTVTVLPNCAHAAFIEQPDIVGAEVVTWLQKR